MNKPDERHQLAPRVPKDKSARNAEPVDLASIQTALIEKLLNLEAQNQLSLADRILMEFAVKNMFNSLKSQKVYQRQLSSLIKQYKNGV